MNYLYNPSLVRIWSMPRATRLNQYDWENLRVTHSKYHLAPHLLIDRFSIWDGSDMSDEQYRWHLRDLLFFQRSKIPRHSLQSLFMKLNRSINKSYSVTPVILFVDKENPQDSMEGRILRNLLLTGGQQL